MAISSEVSIFCFTDLQSKELPRRHRGEGSKEVMKRNEIPSPSWIWLAELAGWEQ